MSKVFYNVKVNDIDLKVTDKYIRYGSELIPTPALSFVSVKRKNVQWWIPIVLMLAAVAILLTNRYDTYGTGGNVVSFILLIIGLITLVLAIIDSRKRWIWLYSHSKEYLKIEWSSGDPQPLIDAIFELLEYENSSKNSGTT